uniref:Tetraspanin n=1 Tax=Ciona intestinalis TaxID=7719 RepID=H2XNA6_CIOIN|nr:tetraspanin-4 [Ciona intestinalis]|eukprot:XP_002122596.1 tetraspanin-4 [Ciona intestinalis]
MNTFLKYFFVVFNILFLIGGATLIGFSIWLQYASPIHEVLILAKSSIAFIYSVLALGCLLLILGFCGSLGACFEKKWLLIVYLTVTAIFLLAEIGIVIFAFADKKNLQSNLQPLWAALANETKFLLQERFKCCGYYDVSEWKDEIPDSCKNVTILIYSTYWDTPCKDSLVSWLNSNVILLSVIGGVILFIQIFQVVVTSIMLLKLGKSNRVESRMFDENDHVSQQQHDNQVYESDSIEGDHKRNKFQLPFRH